MVLMELNGGSRLVLVRFFVLIFLYVGLCGASYSASYVDEIIRRQSKGSAGLCVALNCTESLASCVIDPECISASFCNVKCSLEKTDTQACNLLCELTYGYNSTKYRKLLQCMSDHSCLPRSPPDGKCLATDEDAIKNLTDVAQIKGKWWILRGLNCGQNESWPAGFDYFPCQRDEFVFENGQWLDHIAYCGGTNNTCSTPMMNTVAIARVITPGVLSHNYTDPPLKPQKETWRVLSWPHPDWMLYIYCGYTPTGMYAGGSVVTRMSKPSLDAIPSYVENEFRAVAKRHGFDYDSMCISDVTNCSD
jgi:hypothetical protein